MPVSLAVRFTVQSYSAGVDPPAASRYGGCSFRSRERDMADILLTLASELPDGALAELTRDLKIALLQTCFAEPPLACPLPSVGRILRMINVRCRPRRPGVVEVRLRERQTDGLIIYWGPQEGAGKGRTTSFRRIRAALTSRLVEETDDHPIDEAPSSERDDDLAEPAIGFEIAMDLNHLVERERAIDDRLERTSLKACEYEFDRRPAAHRFAGRQPDVVRLDGHHFGDHLQDRQRRRFRA
jgi:hypothetical protein